jgi:hypothetical protein
MFLVWLQTTNMKNILYFQLATDRFLLALKQIGGHCYLIWKDEKRRHFIPTTRTSMNVFRTDTMPYITKICRNCYKDVDIYISSNVGIGGDSVTPGTLGVANESVNGHVW